MTTNVATPRERIARALTSGFSRRVWDGKFNPSTDPAYNKITRDHVCADFLEDADAVIAHIWEAADDPAVIHQLAGAIGGGGPNSMDSYNSDHIGAAYRAREILLSIIIGPRPQGDPR